MSCPTCTHTMQSLLAGWWWCPRCGMVSRLNDEGHEEGAKPMLVDRVRTLHELMRQQVGFHAWDLAAWTQIGLFEAIYTPKERPK